MVKIDFEFTTQYGVFRDALHFPENAVPTEEAVTALKRQRLDNWLAIVSQPPQDAEPMPLPPEQSTSQE